MTIETYHTICAWLRHIIAATPWEGHVFAVGGCCRDEVMGRPINDVDLAVDVENGGIAFARWLEENGHTDGQIVTFERYGTAMLHLRKFPDHEIELVQTRRGKYTKEIADNPAAVFGSIAEDSARRDFTVNSLFYDITAQQLLDLTGKGLADIEARRLRTPMDADMTFYDDPVRILRCIRMACAWGWEIDKTTMDAMRRGANGLKGIKPERRRAELEKMLLGPNPERALQLVRTTGTMRFLLPELEDIYRFRTHHGKETLWNKALHAVRNARAAGCTDLAMIYACLLHVFADVPSKNPDPVARALRASRIAEAMLRRLHYHSHPVKDVTFLLRNQAAATRWGFDGERAKDRALTRLSNLCTTTKRRDQLLSFIDVLNSVSADAIPLARQIPNIRKRLDALDKLAEDKKKIETA